MKALWIIGIILATLFLISLIRMGGSVDYSEVGLRIRAKIGALRFTVFPIKKRKKKPGAAEKKPPKTESEPPHKEKKAGGGSLELVRQFLPLIAEAAGSLKRKIRIDRLDVELVAAASNPAAAAMAFGGANVALGMILPLLENNFHVKERNFLTRVDFDRKKPEITIRAALSLTIGQALSFGVRYGIRFLKILWERRRKLSDRVQLKS